LEIKGSKIAFWYPDNPGSILDLGCNAGEWLKDCSIKWPRARLAGLDINSESLERARTKVPIAEIVEASGDSIPFPDNSFDVVTSFEVIEHIPAELRPKVFSEVSRVLNNGGLFIFSVPHRGLFHWLDSNNVRHNFSWLYRLLVGKGMRDKTYESRSEQVVYHEHFNLDELIALGGRNLEVENVRRAGLFIYPLMDWLSWPFYRMKIPQNPIRCLLERIAGWDYTIDYGTFSYGIFCAMRNKKGSRQV
jgi:SAM-dependent methyltransferase